MDDNMTPEKRLEYYRERNSFIIKFCQEFGEGILFLVLIMVFVTSCSYFVSSTELPYRAVIAP